LAKERVDEALNLGTNDYDNTRPHRSPLFPSTGSRAASGNQFKV